MVSAPEYLNWYHHHYKEMKMFVHIPAQDKRQDKESTIKTKIYWIDYTCLFFFYKDTEMKSIGKPSKDLIAYMGFEREFLTSLVLDGFLIAPVIWRKSREGVGG